MSGCVCSVENLENSPTPLNHIRLAVILEALQSHKKADNVADDAAILFSLLARSVSSVH